MLLFAAHARDPSRLHGRGDSVAAMARFQVRHAIAAAIVALASLAGAQSAIGQADTTPPETTITEGPAEGSVYPGDDPHFGWSSSEAPATFHCTADGVALSSCEQAYLTGADDGPHTFTVAATDAAGNTDPTPAVRHFTVKLGAAPASQSRCPLDGKQIVGTNMDDTRSGGAGSDIMFGLLGNDLLRGGAGADCLLGQGGADRLFGGTGRDYLYGGAGNDRLGGEAGNDVLHGEAGNDRLTGSSGADSLDGGAGADHLSDFSGRDRFSGGSGNDLIEARDRFNRRVADDVRCGSGANDRAIVDAADHVAADCEHVRRR
jgi:hypothetical protein